MNEYELNQHRYENAFKALAQETFNQARKQVPWRSIKNRIMRKPHRLESFEAVKADGDLNQQHELGTQPVAIKQIVGSMGRADDFDRDFLPRNSRSFNRWMSIAVAHHKGVGLPAVELYKLGNQYYVKDGHHRISVASTFGQTFIDAAVIEVVLNEAPAAGWAC